MLSIENMANDKHHHPLICRPSPLTIPEIAQIVCTFVESPKDMMSLATSCRTMYYVMMVRLWHTLQPRSHMVLRKLKNTLDGRHKHLLLDPQYHRHVRVFRWSTVYTDTHMFERPFFDHFLFPRLDRLEFSYAAAQDSAVGPMIRAARHTLRYLDLSHCYCLSTDAISPLLGLAQPRLETVILYGCGKIDSGALVTLVKEHHRTLRCLRLTDITDELLDAIRQCHHLVDLGLEHCSDDTISPGGLARFAQGASRRLVRLRMRDIAHLTSDHLKHMVTSELVHLDLSECARVDDLGGIARLCPSLQVLNLAYQSGVTTRAIQQFSLHCQDLHQLDVSGSRSLLTEDAFDPARLVALRELNLSGLEAQLSPGLVFRLLTLLPALRELCLGVAYDLAEAATILDQVNLPHLVYQMNVEKCHTICRIDSLV
ncbi:hypothetical protein BC941DRAFT_513213 [Chlamydoabsidia padenii]|nr:hypothetical protein BC941DRAFT_513213 [Chlamydoabsidia padenii]